MQSTPDFLNLKRIADAEIEVRRKKPCICVTECIDIWHSEGPFQLSITEASTIANLIQAAIKIGLDVNPEDPVQGLEDTYQSYKFALNNMRT